MNLALDKIELPNNANNQLNAVLGDNPLQSTLPSESSQCAKFGLAAPCSGILYSKSVSGTANQQTTWVGGIFVKAHAQNILLETVSTRQRITIESNGQQVVFEQQNTDKWLVTDNLNPSSPLLLDDSFNGIIYVAGQIGDSNCCFSSGVTNGLKGGVGPDISAKTQLTIVATGDIAIKGDVTYTEDPDQVATAKNVLGIFSPGGSIKVDGPDMQDIEIHGSLMASGMNKGFGTIAFNAHYRGDHYIHLKGGIIEQRSQGVGQFDSLTGRRTNGYGRSFSFDERFNKGFAPPFFPTQQAWQKDVSLNINSRRLWQLVGN
ncbi:MAG: hypothetical protein R2865_15615 [Deinococcales bacterium]